jgi:predicted enzyme related to lactoylglutathione lyase
MHGQFVWYELTTPDPDAATKFYPRFTNWGTQKFDDNYMMWTHDGVPFAGIYRLNDEMKARGTPPNWMPYIESSDVDGTATKAKSLGATILAGPDDIPGTGRFAVIQDPQGAIFGVYKSLNQSNPWNGQVAIGKPSWHELMTHDYKQAASFYGTLFNWEKAGEMDMGGGQMYYMFGQKGAAGMYGGMFSMTDEWKGMHPFWLVYIHVKDVAKAVEIATRNGASVHRPQMDIPGGSIAILGDPQGAGFAVHHAAPPVAAKAAAAVKSVVKKAADSVRAVVKKAKAAAKKSAPKRTARPKARTRPKAKAKVKVKVKAKTKARARPKVKAKKKAPAKKRTPARRGTARKKK